MMHHRPRANEKRWPLGSRNRARGSAPLPSLPAAFTLVEVVLALGIVAFAVVALVGLMAVSFDSSRGSDADTSIASMARQITAELRARPFDRLTTEGSDVYFFDNEAHRLADLKGAVYRCKVTLTANGDFDTGSAGGAPAQPNLYEVQIDFTSALGASPSRLQSFHTAIARYE